MIFGFQESKELKTVFNRVHHFFLLFHHFYSLTYASVGENVNFIFFAFAGLLHKILSVIIAFLNITSYTPVIIALLNITSYTPVRIAFLNITSYTPVRIAFLNITSYTPVRIALLNITSYTS